MYKFSFSWSIKVDGRRDRGALKVASWAEIEPVLRRLAPHAGSASAYVVEGPEVGPQKMLLFADQGHYVVVLSEFDGNDYRLRSFHNPEAARDTELNILGQGWNARQVSARFDDVLSAYRQLFQQGQVETGLLR